MVLGSPVLAVALIVTGLFSSVITFCATTVLLATIPREGAIEICNVAARHLNIPVYKFDSREPILGLIV